MTQDGAGVSAEMPRYRCHKQVWALKIKFIDVQYAAEGGGWWITPEESGYARFAVSHEYVMKHKPAVGGYYVVYDDGYQSWSPAKAFEDGYARI